MNKIITILFILFFLLSISIFADQTPTVVKIENNELSITKPGETQSQPFVIKGLSWSPATYTPDSGPHPVTKAEIPYGFFFEEYYPDIAGSKVFNYWVKNEFLNHYLTDIPLMKQMNVNTVRIYLDMYNDYDLNIQDFMAVLDELYRNNIMVIMTVGGSRGDFAEGDTVQGWDYKVDSPKATFLKFQPTGWMGNTTALTLTSTYKEGTNNCIKVDYAGTSETDWAGIYWQYPMNNWGEQTGMNLTGENRLVLKMRGEKGGEKIDRIVVGGITNDTASEMLMDIRLTPYWREYTIDLTNKDLSNISGGFAFTIGGTQNCTFYLDEIKFVKKNARYLKVVNTFKKHPAILAWALGNEWNLNYGYGFSSVANGVSTINDAAAEIKKIDPNHPVISIMGDVFEPNQWLWNIPECVLPCTNIDAWGINAYRGNTFGALFYQWKNVFTSQGLPVKPFFISEMGLPSYLATSWELIPDSIKAINVVGDVNEEIQRDTFSSLWTELAQELSATSDKACLGGMVHEFNDECWKVGNYYANMGGMVEYGAEPYYRQQDQSGFYIEGLSSRILHEEYFGVVTPERVPKAIFYEIQNKYGNTAPEFEAIPDKEINEGESFYLQVIAHDTQNDPLIYSVATELPAGSSFDPVNQIFSWQPRYDQSGEYTIPFKVSDGSYFSSAVLHLKVLNVPLSVSGSLKTNDNSPVSDAVVTLSGNNITLTAVTDTEGNYILQDVPANVPYSITSAKTDCAFLPASVTGDAITSNVSGLNFTANRAPELAFIGNITALAGKKIELTLSASDPDNDPLIFSAENLPSGAVFNPDTRVFSWTPEEDQAGAFTGLIFKVTDGFNFDEELVSLTVRIPLYPDLTLTTLATSSESVPPSGTLPILSTVKNIGTLVSDAFAVEFHLSSDAVFGGADDIVLTPVKTLSDLEINEESTDTVQVTLPASILPGTYYLIARVDSANAVDEKNEENNLLVATTPVQILNESMAIKNYETEVTDGVFNATLELAGLDAGSTYEVLGQLYSSDWKTQIGEKKMTVANGQVNLEITTSGASGSNYHFLVYLFKDKNYSYSNPEAKEVRNNINIVYTAQKLTIAQYETEVTDGVFNVKLELAGLNTGSTYEVLGQLYSSDWKTQIGEKKITVANGQVNLEITISGTSGSNYHFLVYLFKDKNYSYSNPEAKEVKNYINIS